MLERAFSVDINADVQRVWDEITRRGVPHQPMFGTFLHGDLSPGSVLTYRGKNGRNTFVLGEVFEVRPPSRLVHTFRFSMHKDAPTLVEWDLTPTATGTRVTVTHSRFEGETKTYKAVSTSWPKILGLYKTLIETGRTPLGTRLQNGMMSAMSFMLPKSVRTENALKVGNRPPGPAYIPKGGLT